MKTRHAIAFMLAAGAMAMTACAAEPTEPTEPSPPPSAEDAAATGLEGGYSVTWTADELYERFGGDENPDARALAEGNAGELLLTFDDDGTYGLVYVSDGSSCPGTYAVEGDRVVMTATNDPTLWDCGDGLGQLAADARWTLGDDSLTLTEWELSPDPAMDWANSALLGDVPLARVE